MKILKKGIGSLRGILSTIYWCLTISWKASKFYTSVRIFVEILTPVLVIVMAYIGRGLINLLAGQWVVLRLTETLLFLLVGLFLSNMVRVVLQKASQYCQSMHEDMLKGRISIMLMEYALAADLEYFDDPDYRDKLQSADRDSTAVAYIVWNALSSISATVSFLSIFFIMFQTSPLYGFIIMVAAIPASVVTARYTKLLYGLSLEQINGMRQMGYCQGIVTDKRHAQELRLLQAGEKIKLRYLRIWSELFNKKRSATRKRTVVTGALELLPEVAVAWVGIDIALGVLRGSGSIGDYSFYTGLVMQLVATITMLSTALMHIYDNKMQMDNFKTIDAFENHVVETGDCFLGEVDAIEFDQVSFTYPGAVTAALEDVSFRIRKEQKVAFVGLNGSGKSTMIKLLLRLYNPDKGVIKINGMDIRDYTLDSLRANFSVYFQDMINYCFTLRENFTIADGEHRDPDRDIEKALAESECGDILEKATNHLDTQLTRVFESEGIELSGGQNQKLALARALYRRHTALILDEPSSNLDPKAEHDIFEDLRRLTDGKMTLFTSHRLSNVFLADRIVVLEKGRVIEDGVIAGFFCPISADFFCPGLTEFDVHPKVV